MPTLAIALALILAALQSTTEAAAPVCPQRGAVMVVVTGQRQLFLCEEGRAAATLSVRLGRGGVGKAQQGDNKVPLGRYALGAPRPSEKFGVFIPIGYPTPAQKKRGHTGSGVGVHGPHRWVRWLGRLVNTFDSTEGCVGLATDADMARISDWVRQKKVRTIEIR